MSVGQVGKDADAFRLLALPDTHGVFSDEEAIACALALGRRIRPRVIVMLGDHVDFYQLSRFDKDPARVNDLQRDIDAGAGLVKRVRRMFPDASVFYLCGNHEDRLRRFLFSHAPALKSLRGMRLETLLGLREHNVKFCEDGVQQIGSLLFKHGDVVRAKAGQTAMAELEREGMSGVSGHTHRAADVSKTNRSGTYKWIESGCLCSLKPEYMPGQVPDWQHAVSYGTVARGGRFVMNVSHIINGKAIYGDRLVSA